jgi:hypothetical protein
MFADLGGILGFTDDETQTLVDGLGYDVRTGRRIWPRTSREAPEPGLAGSSDLSRQQ